MKAALVFYRAFGLINIETIMPIRPANLTN